jgi:hypothetical protein
LRAARTLAIGIKRGPNLLLNSVVKVETSRRPYASLYRTRPGKRGCHRLKNMLNPLEIGCRRLAGSSASKKRRCSLLLEARTTAREVTRRTKSCYI